MRVMIKGTSKREAEEKTSGKAELSEKSAEVHDVIRAAVRQVW